MDKFRFKIEPKQIIAIDGSGDVAGVAVEALLRVFPYELFAEIMDSYVEYYDEEGKVINVGFNKKFPTPQDWGQDDMTPILALASALKITIKTEENENN